MRNQILLFIYYFPDYCSFQLLWQFYGNFYSTYYDNVQYYISTQWCKGLFLFSYLSVVFSVTCSIIMSKNIKLFTHINWEVPNTIILLLHIKSVQALGYSENKMVTAQNVKQYPGLKALSGTSTEIVIAHNSLGFYSSRWQRSTALVSQLDVKSAPTFL
jgi:hypothetical protein